MYKKRKIKEWLMYVDDVFIIQLVYWYELKGGFKKLVFILYDMIFF